MKSPRRPTLFAVTVQIFCESEEEAIQRTIIPGSVKEAEVEDLAHQTMNPPTLPVPPAPEEDFLPLGE